MIDALAKLKVRHLRLNRRQVVVIYHPRGVIAADFTLVDFQHQRQVIRAVGHLQRETPCCDTTAWPSSHRL